jgi:hypothetical protein
MNGAAGNGLGTTIKYLRQTTSGAAGNGLGTTVKYLRQTTSGASGNDLRDTVKYLRKPASGAASNGLGTTIKYLRGATDIGLDTTVKYLRRAASGVAGSGFGTTVKYLRGAADSDLGFAGSLIFMSPRTGHGSSQVFEMLPAASCVLWSIQVKLINNLPKSKSKTRSKQNKDMRKCSSVYSERGVPLPVLTSGGE